MTRQEAYKILGIPPDATGEEIKKTYRRLMQQVHPDSGGPSGADHAYSAREINAAYELLRRGHPAGESGGHTFGQTAGPRAGKGFDAKKYREHVWNAPLNVNAYMEREILCYAEDYDGTVLGNFSVAKGKYLWTTEEDFPLFLLSIYRCGKRLLDEWDERFHGGDSPASRPQVQAELTYLFAQQFIDATALLRELAKEEGTDKEGDPVYYIPSMLELTDSRVRLAEGGELYPCRLRQHRLYLKDGAGQEAGYLSFLDDRLYYVVVPLFEQKRVRVRIRTARGQEQKKRGGKTGYRNLDLWLKLRGDYHNSLPENLNMQIEKLLEKYQKA